MIDYTEYAKIYLPIVLGALAAFLKTRHSSKKKQERVESSVQAVISRCEEERTKDQKLCERQHEELKRELREVREDHAREYHRVLDRFADCLEYMTRRRKQADDSSDTHRAIRRKDKT